MRVAAWRSDGVTRPCIVVGDGIVDVSDRFRSTKQIIAGGADALRELEALGRRDPDHALAEVTLAAPLEPRNVFCVGWNYLKHFEEGAGRRDETLPDYPNFFGKATNAVAGPYDDVPAHTGVTQSLDWEAELAVVIGEGGRDVPEGDALGRVFGYTVANDLSARDLQRRPGVQWLKGKSLDGTCPLGPWIVTGDELGDPQSVRVSSAVNDETQQDAPTAAMIFSVARLVSLLSQGMTLVPGDILLTGTPEGVGMGQDPPRFLRSGDVVECSVERIGTIRNAVVERS